MNDAFLYGVTTELKVGDGDSRTSLVDIVVLPDGKVTTSRKGSFIIDEVSWASIKASFAKRGTQIVVDYEHQSVGGDYARVDGLSPAAGWIHSLRYEPGVGIIASVQWTDKARAMIVAKEYKYPSASFYINKKTGRVTELVSVAITNTPATPDIAPLAASDKRAKRRADMAKHKSKGGKKRSPTFDLLSDKIRMTLQEATPEEEAAVVEAVVEEIDEVGAAIADLKAALGLGEDASPADVVRAAIERLGATKEEGREDEGVAVKDLKEVRAALMLKDDATVHTMIAKINRDKATSVSASEYKVLSDKVQALEGDAREREAEELVSGYVEAGKLNPNDADKMEWAQKQAAKDAEAFVSLMDGAPKLFEPGRVVDKGEARRDGKTSRQKLIDEEVQSYKDNAPSGIFGDSSMESIVNTGLRMKDEPVMTEAETKVLEGGKA